MSGLGSHGSQPQSAVRKPPEKAFSFRPRASRLPANAGLVPAGPRALRKGSSGSSGRAGRASAGGGGRLCGLERGDDVRFALEHAHAVALLGQKFEVQLLERGAGRKELAPVVPGLDRVRVRSEGALPGTGEAGALGRKLAGGGASGAGARAARWRRPESRRSTARPRCPARLRCASAFAPPSSARRGGRRPCRGRSGCRASPDPARGWRRRTPTRRSNSWR